jgi:hypothetical protein
VKNNDEFKESAVSTSFPALMVMATSSLHGHVGLSLRFFDLFVKVKTVMHAVKN